MFSFSRTICIAGLMSIAVLPASRGKAAFDHAGTANDKGAEVVVYVAQNSQYSDVFRANYGPAMMDATRPRGVPVRFVDVMATSSEGPGLAGPIDTVPTVVVLRNGLEEGRIVGLFGPTEFLRMLAHLLRAVD